ncbi:MAG: DinB family protein [Pyrinomonadaceae bacterium]|nr:DinB family protein [Pyrinomonadaceae bacterium]
MNYQSIDEIYEANDRASERLIETLKRLTAEQANKIVDGEKWSPAHLVEHVAIVEGGMAAICAKLLKKAEAAGVAAAAVGVSENFVTKGAELAVMKYRLPRWSNRPARSRSKTPSPGSRLRGQNLKSCGRSFRRSMAANSSFRIHSSARCPLSNGWYSPASINAATRPS